MLLKRIYDDALAQASWLVGCQATGTALVIDPNRDVAQYVRAAEDEGLRITHVTETHIHADFVSGSRELAQAAGAELLLSAEGGPDWQYAFAGEPNVTSLHDGDSFMVGNIRLDVVHTPGHTPEHISFLLTDTPAGDRLMGAFTGDFIFVGDVGRPDLLERAAGIANTMEAGAHTLFASLQRFKALPDYLQIWPGHGAGSACGKSLGAVPSSTLGYEKLVNWGLATTDEDDFVRQVLEGQPEPPAYFAHMKRINREGPHVLGGLPRPNRLAPGPLVEVLARGITVIDTRRAADFAARYVPGTINVPAGRSLSTYAGSVLPFDVPYYLICNEPVTEIAARIARDLTLIGYDRVMGAFGTDAIDQWQKAGRALGTVAQLSPEDVAAQLARGDVCVIDVRKRSEWDEGHVPGAAHIPLAELVARSAEIPTDRPLVMQCQGGGRSSIAASVLRAHGVAAVDNLAGGFTAWTAAGLPVDKPTTAGVA
jgi:hydroxyacylglutathione hydrolase